jgi:hypothetical protein
VVGSETLTRVRPSARDGNGDPVAAPAELVIVGCVVWPVTAATGAEKTSGQDTVIVGYAALLPPGSDVVATDQLRWRGLDYDVTGEPGVYATPFTGTDPGVHVSMRRVTG